MVAGTLGLQRHFRTLRDPRRVNRCQHRLLDAIAIAICAVIVNADDWQGIETFGRDRHDWLKPFLQLPNGIPCHDTFERVLEIFLACRKEKHSRHFSCNRFQSLEVAIA